MTETRPIEITFDTKQKVASLKIVTGLDAADELRGASVEIVARNVQAAAGPCPAEVGADVKSGPVIGWRCDLSFDWGFGGQV